MARTIALKGEFIRKEGEASGAITPGHLVEFGGANDLQVQGTAGAFCRKAFAVENDLIGDGISDAYASGDTVQYGVFSAGTEVYALLAAGENVAKGAALVAAGDGSLQAASAAASGESTPDEYVVAFAMEAVNNSAASTQARIIVEVA